MTPVQIGRAVLTGTGVDLGRLVGLQDERREPVDMTCLIAQRPFGHRDRFTGRVGQQHPLAVQLGRSDRDVRPCRALLDLVDIHHGHRSSIRRAHP